MIVHQPEVTEVGGLVYLYCPLCDVHKTVECTEAKFAYKEVSSFRKEHEHVVEEEEL